MTEPKTIILEDSMELHLDPVGDQIELAIKERTRFGLSEHSRIRLPNEKRIQLAIDLLGDDLEQIIKRVARDLMIKEAA